MVILSNIVKDGKLISQEDWEKKINKFKHDNFLNDQKEIEIKLQKLIINAIKKRIPNEKFGIFLSGGVDSSFISYVCKKFTNNFTCYSVGTGESADINSARKFSEMYNINWKHKILTIDEMEDVIVRTAKILSKETTDAVSIGVGSVELACIDIAKKDNITYLFGGIGSEEIFAGYKRHEDSIDINEECLKGLYGMLQRDLIRDFKIANATNVNFLTPLLDNDVVDYSMKIDSKLKIKEGYKKYIFRKVASNYGMDDFFSFRPKKAAQYGSNFHKALKKVAKKNGHNYIKEYLKSLF